MVDFSLLLVSLLDGSVVLCAELLDASFDAALEAEASEVEAAHGPVGLFGPGHERVEDGDWWIDPAVIEFDVGVDPWTREATAVELAGT